MLRKKMTLKTWIIPLEKKSPAWVMPYFTRRITEKIKTVWKSLSSMLRKKGQPAVGE